jgi:hypothetical protein
VGGGVLAYLLKRINVTFPLVQVIIVCIAISCTVLYLYFHLNENFHWFYYKFFRFSSAFFIGGSLYILRKYVYLNISWLLIIIVLMMFALYLDKTIFFIAYTFAIPYIVLFFAYIPKGKILSYNALVTFHTVLISMHGLYNKH